MKTTVDLPDAMFRQARAFAAAHGVTLRRFFTEAIEEQLRRHAGGNRAENQAGNGRPPWMAGFGALSDLADEHRHVLGVILDTNALSAWAEGHVVIEAPFRSAERPVVPSVVLGEYCFDIRQSRHRNRYNESYFGSR